MWYGFYIKNWNFALNFTVLSRFLQKKFFTKKKFLFKNRKISKIDIFLKKNIIFTDHDMGFIKIEISNKFTLYKNIYKKKLMKQTKICILCNIWCSKI